MLVITIRGILSTMHMLVLLTTYQFHLDACSQRHEQEFSLLPFESKNLQVSQVLQMINKVFDEFLTANSEKICHSQVEEVPSRLEELVQHDKLESVVV